MNLIKSVAASAALFTWSLASVSAAPMPKQDADARTTLQDIERQSFAIADTAFELGDMAKKQTGSAIHQEGLAKLRTNVNSIGGELQALEDNRDSLSGWEVKVLDQTLPLMQEMAKNTESAILAFNSDRRNLWSSSYVDDTAQIVKEADKVSAILRDNLKLAKVREKEAQLEQSVGEATE